jgi:hypothetical protein
MPNPLPPIVETEIRLNAWTGAESPVGNPTLTGPAWGLVPRAGASSGFLRSTALADPRNWRDPEVGWGLVLPDNDALDAKAKAAGEDAPEPLKKLLADRGGAPVLRWRPEFHDDLLRRYYDDGLFADLSVAASARGVARHQIPRYLLIYAEPTVIPWTTQYILNRMAFTGRLTLQGAALERYVDHLISNWAGSAADARKPVVWSVDHGYPDISWLMRGALAEPVWLKMHGDNDLKAGAVRLDAADAKSARLVDVLGATKTGFVITTSHGATPYLSPATIKDDLGLLVDVGHGLLRPADLLAAWAPDGAVWYSHACCSAGSDAASRFQDLFAAGDAVGDLLRGVATGAGAMVAPLPMALLSADKPLGAWVGHVEPTFDWTLRDPSNGQVLSSALVRGLYQDLYLAPGVPIGYAIRAFHEEAADFMVLWQRARDSVNAGDVSAIARARYLQLVAMDRQALVILGDPTVSLRPF